MKKIIKGISVLLTVCLLLSVTGISALAETPENERVKEEQQLAPGEVTVVVNTPEAPAAETPAPVASAAEVPTAEESGPEASPTEGAPTEGTTTGETTTEGAPTEESTSGESAFEEPASEESASEESASKEPESKEPTSEESESKEPASEESESKEPASEEPASKEPATEKSESEETKTEEPASEEPAIEEPAGKEPVSEKPDTQQAAAVGGSSAVLRSAELRVGDHMITVTGELPEGTELKVVKIPEDVVAGMTGKKTLFTYDICLMLDGQVWQPEDYGKDVEVTISDAADAGGEDDISILHVKASVIDGEGKLSEGALAAALKGLADGSVGKENLSTDKNSNGLSFRTSSFSLYLAEMKNSGQSVLLVSNSENAGDSEAEAEQNGIVLEGEGSFDILVTGTLETEGTPVLISESVTPENVSITVWKIDGAVKDAEGEEHVVRRLNREKRCGTVVKIDDTHWRFSADVYDAREMLPWLRTF